MDTGADDTVSDDVTGEQSDRLGRITPTVTDTGGRSTGDIERSGTSTDDGPREPLRTTTGSVRERLGVQ